MKKWKIIRNISIGVIMFFIIRQIIDVIICLNMDYPHPMLGIDAYKWTNQFIVDLYFSLIILGIPLLISIVLLIISVVKLNNNVKEFLFILLLNL